MDCVILLRMPNDKIEAITEMDGTLAIFTREAAIEMTKTHKPCLAYLFQIVECDEL